MSDEIAKIKRERAKRKEALAEARDSQRAIDLAALNDIEVERGDGNVAAVEVSRYSPGLVTLVVVRALTRPELKRFRDRVRGENADNAAAAEEAGLSALLYPSPDSEDWTRLFDAVTGILTRAGVEAVRLAAGTEREQGK
jgi:hypothetical protein